MLGARGSFQDRYEKIKLLGEGAFGFSVASGLLIVVVVDDDVVVVDDDDDSILFRWNWMRVDLHLLKPKTRNSKTLSSDLGVS